MQRVQSLAFLKRGGKMSSTSVPKIAKRLGSVIKLKPELYEKYKELHAAVWPQVLQRIYDSNIRNYTIYYDKHHHLLFSHMEYIGDDLEKDMAAIGSDLITKEWWKVCEPCQESLEWTGPPPSEGGKGGNWWAPMEEVFHDGHPATQYK
ncbi:L-rhamnose mutarotase-like [Oculina patagonica]